ncbi:MAG: molybdopterin-binding protein [Rubrivivax sp.]|nr:molybdopterin-binding protein [Rubrivivax sp.]
MNIGLIIIGDEILSGKRQDKHLPKVIELLSARGLRLSWARYLGDERDEIAAVLSQAMAGGDLVFSCGGIGATPDDHTRQAAAAASGRPLELHPEARELITQRMRDVAAEQGQSFDPDRADNVHRLNMGVFPQGASIIPNPYNKIPGFSIGHVHFVPGFPVMAWPMIEWVLDTLYPGLRQGAPQSERSVIVFGAMEATLTPLMEQVQARHAAVRVFSLPSVDHPEWGRHIELGVKGPVSLLDDAFETLKIGLRAHQVQLGPEMVR